MLTLIVRLLEVMECTHMLKIASSLSFVIEEFLKFMFHDENCEDWDITTKDPFETTKLPWCNPMNILCGYGQYDFHPEGDSKLT